MTALIINTKSNIKTRIIIFLALTVSSHLILYLFAQQILTIISYQYFSVSAVTLLTLQVFYVTYIYLSKKHITIGKLDLDKDTIKAKSNNKSEQFKLANIFDVKFLTKSTKTSKTGFLIFKYDYKTLIYEIYIEEAGRLVPFLNYIKNQCKDNKLDIITGKSNSSPLT